MKKLTLLSLCQEWFFRSKWSDLAKLSETNFKKSRHRGLISAYISVALINLGKSEESKVYLSQALKWHDNYNDIANIIYVSMFFCIDQLRISSSLAQISVNEYDIDSEFFEDFKSSRLATYSSGINKSLCAQIGPISIENDEDSFSSKRYWEERYAKSGSSGFGSYGRLADFKSTTINSIVEQYDIKSVIEFGCGDGNQLQSFQVSEYVGIDVSPSVISHCEKMYMHDIGKSFLTLDEYLVSPFTAELTLSLDVIYHLVEDHVFEQYMYNIFEASTGYCIIYSCNEGECLSDSVHLKRRIFTDWVESNIGNWALSQIIFNPFPHDGGENPKETSFSNFYIYTRKLSYG